MQIVGIDEAGRGCWAGPLVAAAVLLRQPVIGLKDSKTLSRTQRERLSKVIYESADIGIGWVTAEEIDCVGLTIATRTAMTNALAQITEGYDEIIIDGNYNYLSGTSCVRILPKADSLVQAVSAASIIAKVARDHYMLAAAVEFPSYGFDKHVGYGTALHCRMLIAKGPCRLHRMSYKPVKAIMTAQNV